jgi:hypothetical protein
MNTDAERRLVEMAVDQGPVVARALLTAELQRLRREARKTQTEVAQSLDWSTSKLIRIEGAVSGISTTDLRALLTLYGVTDEQALERFTEQARAGRQRGWWHAYPEMRDQQYTKYLGYEIGAAVIRHAHSTFIPGLLQTEAYARAVSEEYAAPSEAAVITEIRMQRQEKLQERGRPPLRFFVLDEAVIRRRVGVRTDPRIMPDQLEHLIQVGGEPQVTISVIPFDAGAHFGMLGPFTLLEFEGDLEDVLYTEGNGRGNTVTGRDERVTAYRDAFEDLLRIALPPDASAELIRQVAKEMTRSADTTAG